MFDRARKRSLKIFLRTERRDPLFSAVRSPDRHRRAKMPAGEQNRTPSHGIHRLSAETSQRVALQRLLHLVRLICAWLLCCSNPKANSLRVTEAPITSPTRRSGCTLRASPTTT
eukprot:5919531-Pleurochrysis_carterae.AAC.2